MQQIFLINEGKTPHYRVPVYSYLSKYLEKHQFKLTVVSEGVQQGNPYAICYQHDVIPLGFFSLLRLFLNQRPNAVIFWASPHLYLLPLLIIAKLLKIKLIHWGHRRPLPPFALIKSLIYNLEHWADDAIILYSEALRKHVYTPFRKKVFVANNTLDLPKHKVTNSTREATKEKHGIHTRKNIICMGRMQRRKRIQDLFHAFQMLEMDNVGLIVAGPDSEGILKNIEGNNVFKVGALYGLEGLDLLCASDVYCLPGAIGLGIVDAFYCGLPVVTENVMHGPEIMYLKDGVNGFMIPEGDINQLTLKLRMILTDDDLRMKFSQAARKEIMTNGHIDRLCEGFVSALQYVCK